MSRLPQYYAAFAATLGAFGLGTVLSWSSPAIPDLKEDRGSNIGVLSSEQESWVGSILPLGALVSGPVTGILIDKIGRRTSMLILSAPFVLGWLLIAFAQNLAMLLAGRFLTGLCGGAFSLAAPVYIGECVEVSIRGMLGSAFQLMVTSGILFGYVVGSFVDWQWLSIICAVIPFVFLLAVFFAPESPRYLLMKKRRANAAKALCWLRGTKSESDVQSELLLMEAAVKEDQETSTSFADFKVKHHYLPTLYMLALMFFQQLSGINAVIFYSKTIFADAGSTINDDLSSIIIGIVQVLATWAGSLLVDRAGRRFLLMLSSTVMGISLVALGAFFQLKDGGNADSIGWLPLVSLMIFIIAFSVGYGPLPWMMMGELLPPKIRSSTAALNTAFNWFLAFIVTKFFDQIQEAMTIQWCYWLFAIVCGVGTVFVFIFLPETKGKTNEEIQEHFGAVHRFDAKNGTVENL